MDKAIIGTQNAGYVNRIIRTHARLYPEMRPTDAVKLLYQSEFGGGHMIADPEKSLARLKDEYRAVPHTAQLKCEDIGSGMSRLYLNGLPECSLASVNALFVIGAGCVTGSMDAFLEKLSVLEEIAAAGVLPFTARELGSYLDGYRAAGCPMVSHSEHYRSLYAPAYRVIPAHFVPFLPVIFAIDRRISAGERCVLAIDGQCGSGKSTLARLLAKIYDSAVIAMDDFFLPPALRSTERLSESGGNIHYERFEDEILPHIGSGHEFSYTAFDCGIMDYGDAVTVPAAPLIIVEGSYCLHPRFGRYYDLSVYTRCSMDIRLKRLRARCDNDGLMARFENEWIPMETHYCAAFAVDEKADIIVET